MVKIKCFRPGLPFVLSEKYLKNLIGTRVSVVFFVLCTSKELKFKLWLRLRENYLKILRRTRGIVAVVVFSDYNVYPSLDFDLD